MKKVLALLLAGIMLFSFAACKNKTDDNKGIDVKIGIICLHDENSTYDLNFIKAINEVKSKLGLADDQVIVKTNIPESNECYEAQR